MLTGDHEGAAKRTADMLGIDNFRAQVLPEDKATIIEELKNEERHHIHIHRNYSMTLLHWHLATFQLL